MPLRRIFHVSLAIPTSMGLFSVPTFATTYVPQGTYNTNVTWTLAGSPYVIQSTLSIGSGATLTIEPGVIVKFGHSGNTDRIDVLGTLLVLGTSGQPVTFTSLEDDSIGGDTGGDGPTQGAPGQWYSINVWGLASFLYTDIRYGGAGSSDTQYGAVSIFSGNATFEDSSVRYAQRGGLKISWCTLTDIRRSDFSFNAVGISTFACPVLIREGTTVSSNSNIGVYMYVPSTYAGIPIYVANSDITNNGVYGIKLDVSSSTPVGSQPYGHLNNISGNGGGADKRQLWTTSWLAESDWTNNYWGSSGVVPCQWAPSHVFPYHISYGSPNPYWVPPAPGPVAYGTFQKYTPPITIEYCGADAVKDVPFSSEPLDNTAFTTSLTLDIEVEAGKSFVAGGFAVLTSSQNLPTTLTAVASPAGGSFEWRLGPRLDFSGSSTSANTAVVGTSASADPADSWVHVTYTLNGESTVAWIPFTVRQPSFLSNYDFRGGPNQTSTDPGEMEGYLTTVVYWLEDQFSTVMAPSQLRVAGIDATEILSIVQQSQEVESLTPPVGQPNTVQTGLDGDVNDFLSVLGVRQAPFYILIDQEWDVTGFPFGQHQTLEYFEEFAEVTLERVAREP